MHILDKNIKIEKLQKLNLQLLFIVFLLFSIGVSLLYSAGGGKMEPWALKQTIYFVSFFPIVIIIAITNINVWFKLSHIIYIGGLFLLILVEIIGYKSMGATRWLNLGFISIQPSETMKICLIIQLARYFFTKDLDEIRKTKNLIIPILYFVIPFVLILKQPNLGTALILFIITGVIFFCSGIQMWKFILCIVCVLISSPIVWKYGIKDYQKQRIMTFLNPSEDILKSGYNINQSRIAIGSGGMKGKGYLQGTQTQLEFLPEKQTDFIFTILCEEFGFLGAMSTILLFIWMFCIFIYMAIKCQHSFGRVIIIGVFTNIFVHFFINIGMVMGILPVVGTPLPLISYGGSITVSTLFSLGFVLNADIHRNTFIKTSKSSIGLIKF